MSEFQTWPRSNSLVMHTRFHTNCLQENLAQNMVAGLLSETICCESSYI